jgi:hypothetical protein
MAYSIARTSYEEDGLLLSDHLVVIDDDRVEIREFVPGGGVADAVVIVQVLEGELESVYDVPLERRNTPRPQDAFFVGPAENSTLFLQFAAKGRATLRVLVGRVRRGLVRFVHSTPCRLCKLALSLILHAILVSLGIPPSPTGVFDLSALAGNCGRSCRTSAPDPSARCLHSCTRCCRAASTRSCTAFCKGSTGSSA